MIESTGSSVTELKPDPYFGCSIEPMNLPPFPDDWQTHWHLAARLDQFTAGDDVDVTVAGIRLRITNSTSGLSARSDEHEYPVMVVDDEIFVLFGDEPA
jgi:hypothetical protein